ncbi:PREDICTED: erlin-1-like isoform X2 [Populus euphratica]|uniref:Erlin-1-like isoform X2 n=1 Tax=Populus euphratica TaxID=75702 RepID=A0AAJ6TVX0_POPEU|nr:PREDICTED: erlin-1-like isoform X2 [Populus euphratica]
MDPQQQRTGVPQHGPPQTGGFSPILTVFLLLRLGNLSVASPELFQRHVYVVNQLRKGYVYETLLNYDVQYDNTWIYDKNHHEINQSCSIILFKKFISMFLIRLMKRCKLLFKVLVHVMCLVLKS